MTFQPSSVTVSHFVKVLLFAFVIRSSHPFFVILVLIRNNATSFNIKLIRVFADGVNCGLISANYIQWRLVKALSKETTQKMRELSFQFERVYSGTKEKLPL